MSFYSTKSLDQAGPFLEARLSHAGEIREPLIQELELAWRTSPEAAEGALLLCAYSPLSDLVSYPFPLFLSQGRHAAMLRQGAAREVPEDLFLRYVLPLRVNDEELSAPRELFYRELAPRLEGLPPREAALEVNRWCAEQVTYRATDDRTRSALNIYRSGYGRCGEESVFAVNAYRAVGIPARQIYTPRWAHCDDNHAWVEVCLEDGWHYLGACEPESGLDHGWFTGAAGRAMVIHSREFRPDPKGEVIASNGAVAHLNQLPRYARTKLLSVRAVDGAYRPVEGAEVAFGVVNLSEAYPAAVCRTGPDGRAALRCGLGTFLVRIQKGEVSCEVRVHTPEVDEVVAVLERAEPTPDVWEELPFPAPRDCPAPRLTPARRARDRELVREAAARRAARRRAGGPAEFLADERFPLQDRENLLAVLTEKDRGDARSPVLAEALEVTGAYRDAADGLYFPYIACPRAADEPLTEGRREILSRFPPEQRGAFRAAPVKIWSYIRQTVRYYPELEYDALTASPLGVLRSGAGSPLSQRVLFVAICRTLGIPARLNPQDRRPEFWNGKCFQAADAPAPSCRVVLEKGPEERWAYRSDFALAALEDGGYRTLELSALAWEEDCLSVSLRPGAYRIVTDNRLPNGDLFAGLYRFRLAPGETKSIRLHRYEADLSQMLAEYPLEEFLVSTEDGQRVTGSELTREGAVLLWLEEGAEPTEHILNELLERREAFRALKIPLALFPRGGGGGKLRRVLAAFPAARAYSDGDFANGEAIARRLYADPEKLPLVVVVPKPLQAVYASSGYNVGCGDMILRVWTACRGTGQA